MSDHDRYRDGRFIESRVVDTSTVKRKIYSPDYLVEFWGKRHTGAESWRITGAVDVTSVVRWARSQRVGESFVVYVEGGGSDGLSLSRVYDGFYHSNPE